MSLEIILIQTTANELGAGEFRFVDPRLIFIHVVVSIKIGFEGVGGGQTFLKLIISTNLQQQKM